MMNKSGLIGLSLAIALSFAFSARADEKKVIALGDPKTKWAQGGACSGYAPSYADTLAESLHTAIAETGAFRVLSRRQMGKILKEHKMEMAGLTDTDNPKRLGALLQADYLMGVDLLCHPNHAEFNVKMIDVETAEVVFAKRYRMQHLKKMDRAIRDMQKILKQFGKTGRITGSGGKTEALMMFDSKAFHDSAEYIVNQIRNQIPNFRARVEEVNAYADEITLAVNSGARDGWPGLKLKVERDDEEIGWLYLKKAPKGNTVKAGTTGEISAFEEGDVASCRDWEPVVALGHIEDEEEGDEDLIDLFRERMAKEFEEAEGVVPAEGKKIDRILQKMGPKTNKKDLAKLQKAGVDLLIVGRFSGATGHRRVDFEVLNTVDGKRVINIKRDGIGL